MTTLNELQALACEDCPAEVTAQAGRALDDSLVLTVVVEHEDTCPWAASSVPAGGALLVKPGAMLWHRRAGDPDEVPLCVRTVCHTRGVGLAQLGGRHGFAAVESGSPIGGDVAVQRDSPRQR